MVGLEVRDGEEFDNDDAGYIRWRFQHDHDGFVVNMVRGDPSGSYLHLARCETLQNPIDEGLQLTVSYPKACSTRRSALREYWRGGSACSICEP